MVDEPQYRSVFWYRPETVGLARILEVTPTRLFVVPVENDYGRNKYAIRRNPTVSRELTVICAKHQIEPTDPRLFVVPVEVHSLAGRYWSWRLEFRP